MMSRPSRGAPTRLATAPRTEPVGWPGSRSLLTPGCPAVDPGSRPRDPGHPPRLCSCPGGFELNKTNQNILNKIQFRTLQSGLDLPGKLLIAQVTAVQ